MFNNRMLAVAAVLVMAVPALGAATPIVVPPVPEQLVEGHTVFTVIEIAAVTQTNETRFAAAVAVLVREYNAERNAQRFPGVLWFNDQYLVNPEQATAAVPPSFRYPCGGAVMAVNQGDPDPRVVIARVNIQGVTVQADLPDGVDDETGDIDETVGGTFTVGDSSYEYGPEYTKPYPGVYQYENDYAWIGADVGPSSVNETTGPAPGDVTLYSDTVLGTLGGSLDAFGLATPWDYDESYLVTDPNDHAWIIDKYNFYTRDGISTAAGPISGEVYSFPVWVVNTLGSPVFVPDNGIENCLAFKDLLQDPCGFVGVEDVNGPVNDTTGVDPGVDCSMMPDTDTCAAGGESGLDLVDHSAAPPWTDNPCMSYQEPSRNGFCYGGQEAQTVPAGEDPCPHGAPGNTQKHNKNGALNEPFRLYNALLYFKLEDLTVWDGSLKDHCNFDATIDSDPDTPGVEGGCNPALSPDTNGCSEEQYPWGPNPPQAAYDWPCPDADGDGVGDDNAEGNSHPFHPTTPPHLTAEPCLPQFSTAAADGQDGYRRNPSNHGGSSYITPGTPATSDGWYQVYAPCDYMHTTRNVDIYFSPGGRPFPPVVRWFDVIDAQGSSAPFQDYHASYPGADPVIP